MLTRAVFRAEDLEWLQGGTGKKYELIRGELFEPAPVTSRHGQVAGQTYLRIQNWNEAARGGVVSVEAGYALERDPDTVRVPDISFVSRGRLTAEQARRGIPDLAPDLAVEVRSPNDPWPELVRKAEQFMAAGTRLVWLIEPDEFVEVRGPGREPVRLGPDDLLSGEDVLPGFECRVRDLFPEEYY